jgi:histidinol dehydrogenase
MNVTRYSDTDFLAQIERAASASSLFDPIIEERTRAIMDAVRARGDAALIELTERFDLARLAPDQIAVTAAENMKASVSADERRTEISRDLPLSPFGRRGSLGTLTGRWSVKNSIRFSAWAFTFQAVRPRWFRPL